MAKVIFKYNGDNLAIYCDIKDKFKEIFKKFVIKSQIEDDRKLMYLYGGNKIDENSTFEENINMDDKEKSEITLIVQDIEESSILKLNNKYKTEDILCPKCGENIFLRIKDYKINLYGCKNGHNIKDILLAKFENTKLIDPSNTLCGECKEKNINNIINKKIYICTSCQINLCPLCKSKHDKSHKFIDFNDRNSFCKLHCEVYIHYCTKCKSNICMTCEKDHKDHKVIYFGNILPDKAKIKNDISEIRCTIDKFKKEIKNIIYKLNEISDNFELFFNICNEVVKDYETKKRNYQILMNIKELEQYKLSLSKDIDKIIKEDNIFDKFYDIMDIGYKMENTNNIKKNKKDKIIELNNKIITLENYIKEENKKNENLIDNLIKEIDKKQIELNNLKSNLSQKDEELKKLNNKNESLIKELDKKQTELNNLERHLSQKDEELRKLNNKKDSLIQKIDKKQTELDNVESNLKKKEEELRKLNSKNDSLIKEQDKKQIELNNLKSSLVEKEEELKKLNSKNDSLIKEQDKKQTELNNLKSSLAEKEEELKKLNSKNCYPENNAYSPYNYQQPNYGNQQIFQYQQNYYPQPNYYYQGNYYGTQFPNNLGQRIVFHEHPLELYSFDKIPCSICDNMRSPSYKCEKCELKLCQSCFKFINYLTEENARIKHPHLLYIKTKNKENYKCNNCGITCKSTYYFYCEICKYYKCPNCNPIPNY